MNTRSVRFPIYRVFDVSIENDGAKMNLSEEVDARLTQVVLEGLKAKFPDIDETVLSSIMMEQRKLYIDFLNEKLETSEQT